MEKAYFTGPSAPLCEAFVTQKRAAGAIYDTQAKRLRQFDDLCKAYNIQEPIISKEIAWEWYKQRPNEKLSSRRDRVQVLQQFSEFLCRQGYPSFLFPELPKGGENKKTPPDTPFFYTKTFQPYSRFAVRNQFKGFLWDAGITYRGKDLGSRIHDLRHTMVCHNIRSRVEAGIPISSRLPILSKYLGHQSIVSTQWYLRLTADLYPHIRDTCEAEDFLAWLETERGSSASTRNQRRVALNGFFRYLPYRNPGYVLLCQQIRSIPKKVGSRKKVEHISTETVAEILKQPDLSTRIGKRDFALLTLLYESAARVSEITNLRVGDFQVDKHHGAAIRLFGKGRKVRTVPFTKPVSEILQDYLKFESSLRTCGKGDPLCCNRSGKNLTREGVSFILHKYTGMAQDTTSNEKQNTTPRLHTWKQGVETFLVDS